MSADVTVSETTGRQVLKIVSGNVQTQIEAADADITAVSGDVRLRGAGLATNVQVNSVSGDIGGCLDVAAERTSKYAPGQRLRVRRGEGQATLRLKSMSGDIDICDR